MGRLARARSREETTMRSQSVDECAPLTLVKAVPMRYTVERSGAERAGPILRAATAALLLIASVTRAQSAAPTQPTTDARWTPWLGCWQQTGLESSEDGAAT